MVTNFNDLTPVPVPFLYSVFGLYLAANLPIPGLAALTTTSKIDIQVWLSLMPAWAEQISQLGSKVWFVSNAKDHLNQPVLTVRKIGAGDYFQMAYCDRAEFIVNSTGTEIWAIWPDSLTLEDIATYLLGPVLGFVLRLRGIISLHASGIAVGDRCIAILGPAGSGKSTTAASFAKSGFAVLSDDVLPICKRDNQFIVQPAYPGLRLWSKSVQALYGQQDALPCLTPNWNKRYLDLNQPGYKFQNLPLPLGAIYILGDRSNSPTTPFIENLPIRTGLMNLIANTYGNGLLDKAMRAGEFDLLSQVANSVPIKKVVPNTDIEYLSKICEVILADASRLLEHLAGKYV